MKISKGTIVIYQNVYGSAVTKNKEYCQMTFDWIDWRAVINIVHFE